MATGCSFGLNGGFQHESWSAGHGYQIFSSAEEDLVLNYPEEQENLALAPPIRLWNRRAPTPGVTGVNMSVLIASIKGGPAPEGDWISAYGESGELFGAGEVIGGRCGLAVWGDDPVTPEIDGAKEGEALYLRLGSCSLNRFRVLSILSGEGLFYSTDGFTAVEVEITSACPEGYLLAEPCPIPSTHVTVYSLDCQKQGRLSWRCV
jgi:hypothetical protein